MPEKKVTADALRAAADRLEEQSLIAPTASPPLVIGDAQNFPRPAPEARLQAAEGGGGHEAATRVVGLMRDLAATMDEGNEAPPASLAVVAPYL